MNTNSDTVFDGKIYLGTTRIPKARLGLGENDLITFPAPWETSTFIVYKETSSDGFFLYCQSNNKFVTESDGLLSASADSTNEAILLKKYEPSPSGVQIIDASTRINLCYYGEHIRVDYNDDFIVFTIASITPSYADVASGQATWKSADLDYVNFSGVDFTGTAADLTDAQMIGADFSGCDLTGVTFSSDPVFSRDSDTRTRFVAATVPADALGGNWSYLDLSNAKITGLGSTIESLNAQNAVLSGLDFENTTFYPPANFTGADLSGASLTNANLSSAQFKDAIMRGVVATNATLTSADLTGAQLGASQTLFEASADSAPSADSQTVPPGLIDSFSKHQVALSVDATVTPRDRDWVITDGAATYIMAPSPVDTSLRVSKILPDTSAANLSNAYMPNAVFTDANLYAANLPYVQWYGGEAKADNADMENTDFTNANISCDSADGLNFKQAKLYGASFDGANLVNTNFSGAQLGPSSSQNKATFAQANLQGVDFTGASLDQVNLTNASLALEHGVHLCDLPPTVADALKASASASDKLATTAVQDAFSDQGYPLLTGSTVENLLAGTSWTVRSGGATPPIQPVTSQYASYTVVVSPEGSLTVYGSSLWVTRPDGKGSKFTLEVECQPTKLTQTAMSEDTVCPNGYTLERAQKEGLSWEQMVTPSQPPKPPICVPSPEKWCSQ